MKFEEVKRLEKYFKKYLIYEGINLWKLSEAAMYNNFLNEEKKMNYLERKKGVLIRKFIQIKNLKKEKRGKKTREKIVVIISAISHVDTIIPLIKKGLKVKILLYESLSDKSTQKYLKGKKIPYIFVNGLANREIKNKLKIGETFLNESWKKIQKDSFLKNNLRKNYSFVIQALEYFCKTRKVYLEYIELINIYRKFFSEGSFKKLILFDDVNAYGKAAAIIARENKIKSLCIQHGQLQGNPVGEITCDLMAVNGKKDKNFLISRGAKKEKIKITGQIRFDSIAKKMKISKEEICKKIGVDYKKKIIIFTAQKNGFGQNVTESAKKIFLKNIPRLKNEKNYEFIITLREDMSKKKDLPKIDPLLKIKIIKGGDIQEIIACCDLQITAFSTVAIEAVLMGKPVLSLNVNSKEKYLDYSKLGVGYTLKKETEFIPKLEECLESKKFKEKFLKSRKKFIKNFNYKLDGKALERVIKLINN